MPLRRSKLYQAARWTGQDDFGGPICACYPRSKPFRLLRAALVLALRADGREKILPQADKCVECGLEELLGLPRAILPGRSARQTARNPGIVAIKAMIMATCTQHSCTIWNTFYKIACALRTRQFVLPGMPNNLTRLGKRC